MAVTAVVLAAGRSTRFGCQDKLLARLPTGERIIERSLATVATVCPEPVVVVRPGNDALVAVIAAAGFTPLPCPDADLGMGHSLAFGVRQVPRGHAVLVMLGDLPFVAPESLKELSGRVIRTSDVVIPTYRGQRGHPVIFGARWRGALTEVSGDTGARQVIADPGARVVEVALSDPGILRDVDTPDGLERYCGSIRSTPPM